MGRNFQEFFLSEMGHWSFKMLYPFNVFKISHRQHVVCEGICKFFSPSITILMEYSEEKKSYIDCFISVSINISAKQIPIMIFEHVNNEF